MLSLTIKSLSVLMGWTTFGTLISLVKLSQETQNKNTLVKVFVIFKCVGGAFTHMMTIVHKPYHNNDDNNDNNHRYTSLVKKQRRSDK